MKIYVYEINRQHLVPENVYARSLTATHGKLVFLGAGRPVAMVGGAGWNTQSFPIPTPRFAGNVSTWNPLFLAEGAYPQNYTVEQPRNQVWEMHFDSNRSMFLFKLPFGRHALDQRSGDGRFGGRS